MEARSQDVKVPQELTLVYFCCRVVVGFCCSYFLVFCFISDVMLILHDLFCCYVLCVFFSLKFLWGKKGISGHIQSQLYMHYIRMFL